MKSYLEFRTDANDLFGDRSFWLSVVTPISFVFIAIVFHAIALWAFRAEKFGLIYLVWFLLYNPMVSTI